MNQTSKSTEMGSCQNTAIPHGLDGVGEDDLLIRVPFLLVVTPVMNELHLLQDGGLAEAALAPVFGPQ